MVFICRLNDAVVRERDKFDTWQHENIRRKHNYVPMIYHMLRFLAEKGQLQQLITRARELKAPASGQ